MGIWRFALLAWLLSGCDAPPVVSFNTPDSCGLGRRVFTSYQEARQECGRDCVLCIAGTTGNRAVTYRLSHDDNCVCPAPMNLKSDAGSPSVGDGGHKDSERADAGARDSGEFSGAPSSDDSSATADAASVGQTTPCASRLHLTQSEARRFCEERRDCHVCIERVDLEGDARSYLAHECGCPDPYRSE